MKEIIALVGAGLAAIFLLNGEKEKKEVVKEALPKKLEEMIYENDVVNLINGGTPLNEAVKECTSYYISEGVNSRERVIDITHEDFEALKKEADEQGFFYFDKEGTTVWNGKRQTFLYLTKG